MVATVTDPVESPKDFAERLLDVTQALCWEPRHLADLIRARDAAVRREARAPFAWALAEALRCERDIEIRVGSLTTVVTVAEARRALATGGSDG